MRDNVDEVVPDSEGERIHQESGVAPSSLLVPSLKYTGDVIEISSSDEGDDALVTPNLPARDQQVSHPRCKTSRARRVIISSSSEASDAEEAILKQPDIIDLSDSPPQKPRTLPKASPSHVDVRRPALPPRFPFQPLYADDDDSDTNDGSILSLNEPKGARKPIKQGPTLFNTPGRSKKTTPAFSCLDKGSESPIPSLRAHISSPLPSSSPSSSRNSGRGLKKSQAAAEQEKRERYAELLFAQLNDSVFKNGLPAGTKLTWNSRLLCTAGRAKWHRNKEGVETSEIELATKILDCNERIRNTLSHEMCHLASWTINKNPKEGHGKIWKTWAANVMRKHPNIDISTKHNYEITYPYEWQCEGCSKIYGRFSKSIRPDECVCGACKTGKLVPLFTSRAPKTPKVNAKSGMASGKSRESPLPALDLTGSIQGPTIDAFPAEDSNTDIELVAAGIAKFKL